MPAKQRLHGTDDPGRPADLDPVTHRKWLRLGKVPGRKRRAAGTEFVAVTSLVAQARHPIGFAKQSLIATRGSLLASQQPLNAVVEIRALRGSQRSSVYRECVVSDDLFRRLLAAGATRGFRSLTALEPHGPHRLDKQHARRFAREVAAVQDSLREPEVAAIIEIALWCAHATHNSWLTIRRRTAENKSGREE